jgi:hypothetical protein
MNGRSGAVSNSSPERGGGPRGASRVVEGVRNALTSLLAAHRSWAPSTIADAMVPLPVPGRN